MSVCPYVRLSHVDILSKQLYIFSNFFNRRVATPFQFTRAKQYDNIPSGKRGRRMQGK